MLKTKVEISEIFKSGDNFEFKKIDYRDAKISADIEKVRERQNDIRKLADADISSIKDIVFDI